MRLTPILVAAFALLFAAPAYAEDFVFNVPIRIENLRFAESGVVGCMVSTRGLSSSSGLYRGQADFPITDGAFRGTRRVVVNLPAGTRRDSMTTYSCGLWITFRSSGGGLRNGGDYNFGRFVAEYPIETGQVLTSTAGDMTVSGDIPR